MSFVFIPTINGQITLVGTAYAEAAGELHPLYDENPKGFYSSCVILGKYGISIYNSDCSFRKRINFGTDYKSMYNIYFVSRYIFNNDDKIEYLKVVPEDGCNYFRVINEDGQIIYDFGETSYSFYNASGNATQWNPQLYQEDGRYYLLFHRQTNINGRINNSYEKWALPGKTSNTNVNKVQAENGMNSPYPNPSNSEIILPYSLNNGETSTMSIFNINGQLMDERQIDYVFDKIILDVSNYESGIYFYKVKNQTNKFIVN